jgi:hypothetical protein
MTSGACINRTFHEQERREGLARLLAEAKAPREALREQRHHEVFMMALQILMTDMHDSGSYSDDVVEARSIADLAYPKEQP